MTLHITEPRQIAALAAGFGSRFDWAEPADYDVDASVDGDEFGNFGQWADSDPVDDQALHVTLWKDGHAVAVVNLADLFEWAAQAAGTEER
jgi:hypothetical protein